MTLITGAQNIDEVKQRLKDTSLSFKEDDNLMIVYSQTNQRSNNQIDNATKSIILDKATLKPIVTQFNKLYYNDETLEFLKDKDWRKVKIKYCYEGTMILVFYAYDKWYVCTRKCLDARESYWIKDKSYYDLFMESINGKFVMDDLNKDNCYYFILLHHVNRNIVDYHRFGKFYKTVALAMTTKKFTFDVIDYRINDKIEYQEEIHFENIDELNKKLYEISEKDKLREKVSIEGFIIEYQDTEPSHSYSANPTDLRNRNVMITSNNENP